MILRFDGKPVEDTRELPRIVADTPPGESVDVIVIRDGKRVTLKVEVGRLQDEKVTAREHRRRRRRTAGEAADRRRRREMFGL